MKLYGITLLLGVTLLLCSSMTSAQTPPPGDRRIAYIERVTKSLNTREHWLYEINEDGSSAKKVLLLDSHSAGQGLMFSPDGSHLVYQRILDKSSVSHIYCIERDGTGRRQITNAPGYYEQVVWSPNGRQVAFDQLAKQFGDRSPKICIVAIDGAGLQRQIPTRGFNVWPFWSPDGNKLAYTYRDEQMPTAHVMVVDVNRNDPPRKVCEMLTGYLQWSPNGRLLAIENWGSKDEETVVVDVEEPGPLRRLPGKDPHWSPDGSKLAVMQNERNLRVFDVKSGDIRSLTNDSHKKSSLIYAEWSPDGAVIAYTVEDNLEVVHADGSGQNRITNFPKYSRLTYKHWSSDGKKILFYADVASDLANLPQSINKIDEAVDESFNENLYVADAATGQCVQLTQYTPDSGKGIVAYTWLPNRPMAGK